MRIRNSSSLNILLAGFLLLCLDCRNPRELKPHASEQEPTPAQGAQHSELSLIAFDTGTLRGNFRFGHGGEPGRSDFPGVGQCEFTPLNVSLVNATRPNALLMPEWILRPGGPRDGTPWRLASSVKPEPIPHGVRLSYPDEELVDQGLRLTLEYRVIDDMIFLDGYIEAIRRQTHLEFLFASYLPNRLNATYVPSPLESGISWRPVTRGEPWKSSYFISSSSETHRWRRDGRVADAREVDWSMAFDPDWFFAAPILVGIEDSSGLTAVHFVDDNCTAVLGQPHDNDTAHDFTWGWSVLDSGQKVHARAAVWITQLQGTHDQRMAQVYEKYQDWRQSWTK